MRQFLPLGGRPSQLSSSNHLRDGSRPSTAVVTPSSVGGLSTRLQLWLLRPLLNPRISLLAVVLMALTLHSPSIHPGIPRLDERGYLPNTHTTSAQFWIPPRSELISRGHWSILSVVACSQQGSASTIAPSGNVRPHLPNQLFTSESSTPSFCNSASPEPTGDSGLLPVTATQSCDFLPFCVTPVHLHHPHLLISTTLSHIALPGWSHEPATISEAKASRILSLLLSIP
jgi:hypothetical protein